MTAATAAAAAITQGMAGANRATRRAAKRSSKNPLRRMQAEAQAQASTLALRLSVRARIFANPKPLDRAQVVDLGSLNWQAFDATAKGHGGKAHANTLLNAANICNLLVGQGLGAEFERTAEEGAKAIGAMCQRGLDTGRYLFTGPELQAARALVEFLDLQLESDDCTDELMVRVLDLANEAVRNHEVSGADRRRA